MVTVTSKENCGDREGYTWQINMSYNDGLILDKEIDDARLRGKLVFDAYKLYRERPPTEVNITVRIIESINRYVNVTVELIDEHSIRIEFDHDEIDACLEDAIASYLGTEKSYNDMRYKWSERPYIKIYNGYFKMVTDFRL